MLCRGGEMVKRVVLFFSIAVGLGIGAYLLAFGLPGKRSPEPVSAAASPPVEVGIVVVQPAEVPLPMEYAGRVAGFRDVEVRPLVSGLLLKREYEEGAKVAQGQVLFRIDPATYELALEPWRSAASAGAGDAAAGGGQFRADRRTLSPRGVDRAAARRGLGGSRPGPRQRSLARGRDRGARS